VVGKRTIIAEAFEEAREYRYEIEVRKGSEHRIVAGGKVVVADAGCLKLTITGEDGVAFDLTDWEPQVVLKHASVAAQDEYPDDLVVCANPVDLPNGRVDVYVRKKNNLDRMKEAVDGHEQ
jgi:hypothetical protein